MNPKHKRLLMVNRIIIKENIAKPLDLNDRLYEKNIFTESMKQDVEAEATTFGQMRKILDTLPRRGPRAFDAFLECLKETSNDYILTLLGGSEVQIPLGDDVLPSGRSHFLQPDEKQLTLGGSEEQIPLGDDVLPSGRSHYLQPDEKQLTLEGFEEQIPPDDDVLPSDWPNKTLLSQPHDVLHCNPNSDLVMKNWNSHGAYPMRKTRRGQCIIVSNKVFSGPFEKDKNGIGRVTLSTRYGAERDEEDVKSLFENLHFTVKVHKDKTANEIREILREASQDPAQWNAECFVFVICSHGTSTGVFGSDGNTVGLEEITAKFDGHHCPALRGKPKLFFIQACRGENIDRQSTPVSVEHVGQDLSRLQLSGKNTMDAERETNANVVPLQNREERIPVEADILVACATHPGYVSIRHEQWGTWFIQAVVYVFARFAHAEHITELLTLVNRLVSKGITTADNCDAGGAMQVSEWRSFLTRKLYFFPGVIEPNSD